MPKFFQNLSGVICGSEKHSPQNREIIIIGDQLFAVAHSRDEMARMMQRVDPQVTGYVFQHRM